MPDGSLRPRRRRPSATSAAQWPLDPRITVVLFAGLGGACDGLEEAGCPVTVANNHDDIALAAHAARHPHTDHIRGDIFDVDPLRATKGRLVRVLWASPDCRDHSVAKGGAPRSPRVRSLPWQVCRWAGKTLPEIIMLENVREIRGWGPLVAKRDRTTGRVIKLDGSVAAKGEHVPVREQSLVRDKARLGRSFKAWVGHLRNLGYAYQDRDLCCADYGVPTTRRRFFAVARRDGLPIAWPARTHAPRAEAAALGLLPWVAASTIIDWSLPIPSIFDRKKPLAEATMRRIATGLRRHVLDSATPFIVPICHTTSGGARSHAGTDPLPTLTTARGGELAVVAPCMMPLTHQGGPRTYGVEDPLRTVTTAHRGEVALAAAHLTKFRQGSAGADVADPLPTVTANGHGARQGCGIPIGVVGAVLTGCGGRAGQVQPTSPADPIGTITTKGDRIVVTASMIQTGYGEREGQAPRALDIGAPLGTAVAGGAKHAVVAAWMAQHNTGLVGHEAEAPLSTMTCGVAQQQVAAAYLAHLRGTSSAASAENPSPTLTAGGFHIAAVAAFLTKYYGEGSVSQDCGDALGTLTTKPRFGVVTVTIAGEPYIVTDIGMRMLEPHEAAAAHELTLPKMITIDGKTRPLTKTQAMRLIGNSVPKRMAKLLAQANAVQALAVPQERSAA